MRKKFPRPRARFPRRYTGNPCATKSSPEKKVPPAQSRFPQPTVMSEIPVFQNSAPKKKVHLAQSRFPHVTPHHAMSCHERYVRNPCVQTSSTERTSSPGPMKVPPRHVTSRHVASLHATPHHVISHRFKSHHATMTTTNCFGSVSGFCIGITASPSGSRRPSSGPWTLEFGPWGLNLGFILG